MYLAVILCIFAACLPETNGVDSLRFFIIGDMGGINTKPYSTLVERSTAEEMGKIADLYAPHFILELGDNFYFDGVKNVDDERFNLTFESVYTASSLQVPWYLVAGNHDHEGNVIAQLHYSQRSPRWNFPNFWYYQEFFSDDGQFSVGYVFIDTVMLCGRTDDFLSEQPKGPVDKQAVDKQMAFLMHCLKKSSAQYLFVAGHYPIYSIAEHGPTNCLIHLLQPLFNTYRVNGYMCGHDHNLQHLRVKSELGNNLDYFVSGMANFISNNTSHKKSVPPGSSLFFYGEESAKGGFLYTETTKYNMTFTFINAQGQQLYSTVAFPRKL